MMAIRPPFLDRSKHHRRSVSVQVHDCKFMKTLGDCSLNRDERPRLSTGAIGQDMDGSSSRSPRTAHAGGKSCGNVSSPGLAVKRDIAGRFLSFLRDPCPEEP